MRIVRAEAVGRHAPRLSAQERAVLAAVERSLSRYIHLKCGHLSTPEDQLLYACFKPKGRVFYCENCRKWVPQMPRPKPVNYPDEPLF